uniref:Protein E7 n=1 Tax=Bat papillomavirus TaxID=2004707 RepID=A0A2Z2JL16_9PAPI|nr:E7 [Bat papillomavirus]
MRGERIDLSDIVLQAVQEQPPGQVDLNCYEIIEEEEQRHPYRILIGCPFCQKRLRLWVIASSSYIRSFEQGLVENIDIVCHSCAQARNYNG